MNNSDELLWELCRKGNLNAFKKLYIRFYPLLFQYGIKLIKDQDLVKDCIQELFIKLIQNHIHLSPTSHIKSYLFKAFRNKLFDLLEASYPTEEIDLHTNEFFTDDLFEKLFQYEKEMSKSMKILLNVYETLTKTQQEIIYLYYIDELTHQEIADLLEINYQSSKNLLARAVARLRQGCLEAK